ncbi:MAG: DNA-processing protein DprA [Verrucomicrobiota bacterium]|nr:DNA-processing protein DprA [Verrucomicrobiota bacterium]
MATPDQRNALMILNALPGVGPVTVRRLRDRFEPEFPEYALGILGAPAKVLREVKGVGPELSDTISRWREFFDLERELDILGRHKADFITHDDLRYPALLKEIYDPPCGLYCLGTLAVKRPAVAIVGTRRPTLYGRGVAKSLATELTRLGFCIVSGLARGIDTEAHTATLDAGGYTVAVLGNGLDIVYPPENLELYRRIAASGAVLSEFPFGRKADKQTFPRRNRVVSGMCDAVIVVESDENGGSMITARFAAEQGRQVFAVPGRIDQPASRGCHALIRDGATLLQSVDNVLDELHMQQMEMPLLSGTTTAAPASLATAANLSADESAVYAIYADGEAVHPDEATRRSGMPYYTVTGVLMMLELKRLIAKRADGTYEKRFG